MRFDPEQRLGCRDPGVAEIKEHPFFRDVDWGLIERKGMTAPFIPNLGDGPSDVSNFDDQFTQMSMAQTPTDARLTEIMADQLQFSNFTYVHNNPM